MSYISFEKYMEECNKLLIQKTKLDANDLPDWNWAYAHEEGTSVEDAVEFFLEDTGIEIEIMQRELGL